MHVDEDLAEFAVVVFAGVQVDLVAADRGFLDIALATVGQLAPRVRSLDLDDRLPGPRLGAGILCGAVERGASLLRRG